LGKPQFTTALHPTKWTNVAFARRFSSQTKCGLMPLRLNDYHA